MTIKPLYRYTINNSVVDTCNQPDCPFTERHRLIADENKALTKDGINFVTVIDIDKEDLYLWTEVEHTDLFDLTEEDSITTFQQRLSIAE